MVISSRSTFREAQVWASIFLEKNKRDSNLSQHYIQWLMDWDLTTYVKHLDHELGPKNLSYLLESFERISKDEPIQYILGYQEFMGRRFQVSPATLIPREETRGIIDLAAKYLENKPQAKVLDMGTGTGIIAITLKKLFPQILMVATDISSEALEIAKNNGNLHQAAITWLESDLFDQLHQDCQFDLILSNPPYIAYNEVSLMDQSVLKYEPKSALFADQSGLEFYHKIARGIQKFQVLPEQILLEIGFSQASAVLSIFKTLYPKCRVSSHKDFNNRDRFIKVEI